MKKKAVSVLVMFCLMFALGCASQQGMQGAGIGGLVGGAAGALLDKKNPWRGGVIGAGLGAIFGGTIGEISAQAAREAAFRNQTVVYRDNGGRAVEAIPQPRYSNRPRCRLVKCRTWEGERIVEENFREVCD